MSCGSSTPAGASSTGILVDSPIIGETKCSASGTIVIFGLLGASSLRAFFLLVVAVCSIPILLSKPATLICVRGGAGSLGGLEATYKSFAFSLGRCPPRALSLRSAA